MGQFFFPWLHWGNLGWIFDPATSSHRPSQIGVGRWVKPLRVGNSSGLMLIYHRVVLYVFLAINVDTKQPIYQPAKKERCISDWLNESEQFVAIWQWPLLVDCYMSSTPCPLLVDALTQGEFSLECGSPKPVAENARRSGVAYLGISQTIIWGMKELHMRSAKVTHKTSEP